VYTHINETYTAETRIECQLASWVDCYRFNNSPWSMQVSRCVYSAQDFKRMSSKKRSKLFFIHRV